MDQFTFGGSKASVILAEKLEKCNPKEAARVCNYLHKFGRRLNCFKDIKDIEVRKFTIQMLHERHKVLFNSISWNPEYKSFFANVCEAMYRKAVRELPKSPRPKHSKK